MSTDKKTEQVHEIRLDYDEAAVSRQSLLDAIKEMGGPTSAATPKPPAPPKGDPETQLLIALRDHACDARTSLQNFMKVHPYLIAPNILRMWEDNLTETVIQAEREVDRRRQRAKGE